MFVNMCLRMRVYVYAYKSVYVLNIYEIIFIFLYYSFNLTYFHPITLGSFFLFIATVGIISGLAI